MKYTPAYLRPLNALPWSGGPLRDADTIRLYRVTRIGRSPYSLSGESTLLVFVFVLLFLLWPMATIPKPSQVTFDRGSPIRFTSACLLGFCVECRSLVPQVSTLPTFVSFEFQSLWRYTRTFMYEWSQLGRRVLSGLMFLIGPLSVIGVWSGGVQRGKIIKTSIGKRWAYVFECW